MKLALITMRAALALLLSGLALVSVLYAREVPAKKDATSTPVVHNNDAESMRLQGEQRFHANCSRCHAAPQKFPPRVMGTVIRHMRVRATITDADMKLILFYMTQ
jgi:mono/diheme cytochrome c family protein